MISVLFARQDSKYKEYDCCDVYDIDRDATTFTGGTPVIAHPPCRAWGRLSHMARPRPGEKQLANFSINAIRENGGVLEHPIGSRLWNEKDMPIGIFPDKHGGFYLDIDQWDFGHVAKKATRLYIVGITKDQLPQLPPKRPGTPIRSICGNVKNTTRCTGRQREETPPKLIDFLIAICEKTLPQGIYCIH